MLKFILSHATCVHVEISHANDYHVYEQIYTITVHVVNLLYTITHHICLIFLLAAYLFILYVYCIFLALVEPS